MSIVELARHTDTDVVSIRSYEEMGLLPKQRRSLGGKFGYHHEHVERLLFIAKALDAGFSLDTLKDLTGGKGALLTCNDVYRITQRRLAEVRQHIADLKRQEATLSQLIDACPATGPRRDCPILNALTQAQPSP